MSLILALLAPMLAQVGPFVTPGAAPARPPVERRRPAVKTQAALPQQPSRLQA